MMHDVLRFAAVTAIVVAMSVGGSEQITAPSADDVRVFNETKAKAASGDIDAVYKLGGFYARGVGTAKDATAAIECYRKAAAAGDARGQSMLGVCYTNGKGTAVDCVEAMKWFRLAAAQNSAHAQYNLGYMYGSGKAGVKDDVQSAEWYRKAAEQLDRSSLRILGSLYAAGRGVPKDLVQATAWTGAAIAFGDQAAAAQQDKLAKLLPTEDRPAAERATAELIERLKRAHGK